MEEFNRGSLVFDVTDEGPRDGEVIVLLHGFPENRTAWHDVTPRLAEAGYRVLAPDQRGYSPRARPTQRRDYRSAELAADVVALINASGAERAHVIGHDWGGGAAWAAATRHPERLLSVTSLCTPHPSAMVRSMLTSAQLLHSWYMLFYQLPYLPETGFGGPAEKNIRRTLSRSGLPDDAIDRYVVRMREPGAARGAINWYRGLPFSGRLGGSVTVPTMYVYPTKDAFLGRKAADLTGRYVDAAYRYEVLEGRSHWLPEEAPDEVARLILDHVGSVSPTRPDLR